MGAPVSTAASSSGNTSATSATPEFGSDFDSTPASSAASSAGQSVHNFNADEYKQQEHADGNGDNSVDDFTLFPRQAQGQQQSAGNASSAGEAANLNAKDTAERAPASAPQTSNYAFMDNNDAFAAAAAAAGLDFGNVDFNMNFQDINVNGLFNDMNMDMDMNTAAFPNGNLMGMEGNGNSVPAAGTGRNNNNGYGNESNLGQMDAALGMMFMDNMDIDTTPMEAEFVQFQQQFLQGDANANPQPLNTGANNEDWSSANMKWDEQRYPFNTTGYQSTATQQQQQQQQYHGANNNDPNNKFGSMSSSASMSPPSLGNSPSSLASTMSLSDIFDVNSHQNVQGRRHKHHQYHRGSTQRNDLFADFDAFMVKPGVEADGQEMLRPRQDSNSHSPVSPRAANDDTVSPLGGRGNLDTTLYSAAVAECSQPTSQQEMLDLKARLNPSTAMNGEPLNGVDGGELTPTPTRRESAPSRQLPQQLNKQQWRSQRANSSIEIGLGNGNGSAFGSQSQQQHAAGMPSFNEDEFVNYGPASVASQSQQLAQPAFDMTTLFV
ncbi:hypothetical protein KEM55_002399 [Ascosphaera atra]|nr:hypothetical protein KEM55_002399 [Ascosphaera atra]